MKKKQTIEQMKEEGLVTTADQISTQTSWINQIEAYCGEMGILPNDLIETHRQSLKMARKGQKNEKMPIKEAKEQISNWRSDYIKKKTGIGLLPEKIKDPYKNQ